MTGVQIIGTLALFQTFGHDVLNIVHVSIGGFVIRVERCSTMRCLAGTAQYFSIELYIEGELWIITANCGGWELMIHVRV